jgi:putative addiction module component (TIGR02574 family)
MSKIEEILQLSKEEQIAILQAIQDNLDEEKQDMILNEDQVAYIRNRVKAIQSSNAPTYSWNEMKEKLNRRWDTK